MTKSVQLQIRALLIDDDQEDKEFFEDALSEYQTDSSMNWLTDGHNIKGEIKNTAQQLCNIIFLDIKMPLMDGLACLAKIRTIKAYDLIPVVMFSSFSFQSDIDNSYLGGANLYVQKPYEFTSYHSIFKNIFNPGWQSALLQTSRSNYLMQDREMAAI